MSDTTVYQPEIRGLLGTAAHFCKLSRSSSASLGLAVRICSRDYLLAVRMFSNNLIWLSECSQVRFTQRVARAVQPSPLVNQGLARECFIDNLQVRIRFIIVVIRSTGLALWAQATAAARLSSRGGPACPQAGLSIPKRVYPSQGGPIDPEAGLSIPRRA